MRSPGEETAGTLRIWIFALSLLTAQSAMANGVGWGPPQFLLPYEGAVVLVEWVVIWLVLQPGVFRALWVSLVANSLSWAAGIFISIVGGITEDLMHGAGEYDPMREWNLVLWTVGGQILLFGVTLVVEGRVWIEMGRFRVTRGFVSTLIILNLVTWSVGMWLLSLMVEAG